MKSYTVYFSEPVCYKFIDTKSNREIEQWDEMFVFLFSYSCKETN